MDLVEELIRAVAALEGASIPYAISGGMAVVIHGRPRLTVDLNFIILRSALPQAIEAVKAVGFDIETGWVAFPDCGLGTGRLF